MTAGNHGLQALVENTQRCPTCGRKSFSTSRCSACNAEMASPSVSLAQHDPASIQVEPHSGIVLTAPSRQREIVAQPLTVSRPSYYQSGREISGRVLIASAPLNEPADPDHWKWLAVPAWGLVLLISPVAAGIIAWMSAGLLAAAVVIVVCIAVLRFIFSNHLLASWQCVAALRGQHIVEAVPNIAVRLRTESDHEVQLRVKGRLSGGGIVEGDRIRVAGRWRAGIFHVTQLHCARTGAAIIPIQPNSMVPALSGAAILFVTILWLHVAGVPWVVAKLDRARQFPSRVYNGFQPR